VSIPEPQDFGLRVCCPPHAEVVKKVAPKLDLHSPRGDHAGAASTVAWRNLSKFIRDQDASRAPLRKLPIIARVEEYGADNSRDRMREFLLHGPDMTACLGVNASRHWKARKDGKQHEACRRRCLGGCHEPSQDAGETDGAGSAGSATERKTVLGHILNTRSKSGSWRSE
jgi:hypothetical protein